MKFSNFRWIKVENGDAFEGDFLHWSDCYFSNPSIYAIKAFCRGQHWSVEFFENVPPNATRKAPLIPLDDWVSSNLEEQTKTYEKIMKTAL